jgi:hypothetical protein
MTAEAHQIGGRKPPLQKRSALFISLALCNFVFVQ